MYDPITPKLLHSRGIPTIYGRGASIIPTKMILKKKVDNRMIVPIDKENGERAKKLVHLGVKLRNYPLKKNLRLHIVDGRFAMLTIIGKSEKERTIIKIDQEESVQSLREMFISLWEKSKDL